MIFFKIYLMSTNLFISFPFRYAEHVWIQDLDYLDQCTAFVYRTVEFDDCNTRNAFVCEIDPKIIINPLSWQADIIVVSVFSLIIVGLIMMCCVCYCWYTKSKTRHVQRLQRRNSIRQSLRSLNMIDPQGSMRRRNYVRKLYDIKLFKILNTIRINHKISFALLSSRTLYNLFENLFMNFYDFVYVLC